MTGGSRRDQRHKIKKILVCIKQAPDSAQIRAHPVTAAMENFLRVDGARELEKERTAVRSFVKERSWAGLFGDAGASPAPGASKAEGDKEKDHVAASSTSRGEALPGSLPRGRRQAAYRG